MELFLSENNNEQLKLYKLCIIVQRFQKSKSHDILRSVTVVLKLLKY